MPPKDTPSEPAELVLLSLLEERPLYGYAITKEVAARSEGKLRLTPGVLYPLLKQLEDDGLVSSTWEEVKADDAEPGNSGRKRKWYRLSPKGRKRLAKRVASHRAWRAIIDAFLPESRGAEEASS